MVARRKRQADPYAEESSEPEERIPEIGNLFFKFAV